METNSKNSDVKRIALLGKMAAGKTTYANRLVLENPQMRRLAFADPVKAIAREYFGMHGKDRLLLQQVATKMREIDADVWVKALLCQVEALGPEVSVVVDDVRFPNEIAALRNAGFEIRYLDVTPETQRQRLAVLYGEAWEQHLAGASHESERADRYMSLADSLIPEGLMDKV